MSYRIERFRRHVRPVTAALANPRELFGESLPELALLVAVIATVVSAALTLGP